MRGLSFAVAEGELFALLGTNGAGKTSAMVPGRPGRAVEALAPVDLGHVLADVLRTVNDGGRYVDPELAAEAISSADSPLTPREADVLELAADGAPVEEIAEKVSLPPGTVRNYLSSAAQRLNAANGHEAVQVARRYGRI